MSYVIVVGGGPAGMMSAYQASKNGHQVLLIEKNRTLGKKLLLTGNGRCNVTNNCDVESFLNHVNRNKKFLYSSLYSFTSQDMMNLLEENNCPLKEEDNNRIFPVSNSSQSILELLETLLEKEGVLIHTREVVQSLLIENNTCIGVQTNKDTYYGQSIILCTGGKSIPSTGSTGDGYLLAAQHTIQPLHPGLVGLVGKGNDYKDLQGLTLKNVGIKYKKKKETGDLLFTHYGFSGPMILNLSSTLDFEKNPEIELSLDCFPAKSIDDLDKEITTYCQSHSNQHIDKVLSHFLPLRLVQLFLKQCTIDKDLVTNQLSKEKRRNFIEKCKNSQWIFTSTKGFKEAMITCGGISVKDINANTMESKIIKNLKFAGEIIDVDASTGGFNLQIAWSTGYLAGNSI